MAGAMGEIVVSDVDRFYRTLARDAADAIIYADAEGRIAFSNKAQATSTTSAGSTTVISPLDSRATYHRRYSSGNRTSAEARAASSSASVRLVNVSVVRAIS